MLKLLLCEARLDFDYVIVTWLHLVCIHISRATFGVVHLHVLRTHVFNLTWQNSKYIMQKKKKKEFTTLTFWDMLVITYHIIIILILE